MAGRRRDAYEIYHRLYLSGGTDVPLLASVVEEWAATEDAPALTYQLLGDLYRRMGRMEEALDLYKEAYRRL
jgi:hypothetical protein